MRSGLAVLLLTTCCGSLLPAAGAPAERYDVVVISGSSGGIGAALAAARAGARVVLVEDTPVLGGMLANGISNIDTFSYESLSGIFEEFRREVIEYYRPLRDRDPIFRKKENAPNHMDGRSHQANLASLGGRWEPHVADAIFKRLAAAAPNLEVVYNCRATGVLMRTNRVIGVTALDAGGARRVFLGGVTIDATHEGDIAAWAGVPYRVGREPRSPLEPHAGQVFFFNSTGEIMEGSTGRQDRAVVSYGLRLTLKNYPHASASAPHVISVPPPGYDPANYRLTAFDGLPTMPNGKTEMNVNPAGNELQEINWSWPEATWEDRRELYEVYKNNALGFLYYLQHEKGMTQLGLPDDEFIDNGHVPYRVFVREARRIEGQATMTEADINPFVLGRDPVPPRRTDSIAIGHYAIDSKPVLSKTDTRFPNKGDGDFFLTDGAAPFQVPYGAIVPKNVEGLLVPVALSATHVAFSAIRMDPTWMAMGQAAGVAAVLSLRGRTDVRSVPVEDLQRELIRQHCRLSFYWDLPLEHPAFDAVQWLGARGVVSGDADRNFEPDRTLTRAEMAVLIVNALGLWTSVSNQHFEDVGYRHWAFREIETLYDRRLLAGFGIQPRWPLAGGYDPARDSGFPHGRTEQCFHPSQPVTWEELASAILLLEEPFESPGRGPSGTRVAAPKRDAAAWIRETAGRSQFSRGLTAQSIDPRAAVSRAEACMLLAALTDRYAR